MLKESYDSCDYLRLYILLSFFCFDYFHNNYQLYVALMNFVYLKNFENPFLSFLYRTFKINGPDSISVKNKLCLFLDLWLNKLYCDFLIIIKDKLFIS